MTKSKLFKKALASALSVCTLASASLITPPVNAEEASSPYIFRFQFIDADTNEPAVFESENDDTIAISPNIEYSVFDHIMSLPLAVGWRYTQSNPYEFSLEQYRDADCLSMYSLRVTELCGYYPLDCYASVKQISDTTVEYTYTVKKCEKGDINADREVDIADLTLLKEWLTGQLYVDEFSYIQNYNITHLGDCNDDGSVDAFDFIQMRNLLLGKGLDVSGITLDSINLCSDVTTDTVEGKEADEEFILGQTKFAVDLLKNLADDKENVLISPYSIEQALAMTTNGACGNTKKEMETVLGGMPVDDLNEYLYTQRMSQPYDNKCRLVTANSIWCNSIWGDDYKEDFLKKNLSYYNSEVYKSDFDLSTLRDINKWVNAKTNKLIPSLFDEDDPQAIENLKEQKMCLINAVSFDAKWDHPYTSDKVYDSKFTCYDGTQQDVEMLRGDESVYISDENAEGMLKYYKGGRYAFAALLPKGDMTVSEYISTLTPESFNKMLVNRKNNMYLDVRLPKFETDYSQKLVDSMKTLGMKDVFDREKSDLSGISDTAGYVSDIIHQTKLTLDEEGTRAAAVTAVLVAPNCAMPEYDAKLYFDRPFVYAIVDTQTNLPVFIGTLLSVK